MQRNIRSLRLNFAFLGDLWRLIKHYLASSMERWPVYVFPLFLIILELFFRNAYKLDTIKFIGPTMAAAGLGLIIPLTTHKSNKPSAVAPELKTSLEQQGYILDVPSAKTFRSLCFILTFALIVIWLWSIQPSTQTDNAYQFWMTSTSVWPGLVGYFVGVVLSEIKERI